MSVIEFLTYMLFYRMPSAICSTLLHQEKKTLVLVGRPIGFESMSLSLKKWKARESTSNGSLAVKAWYGAGKAYLCRD
jgi:hypothetical protein